MRVSEWDGRGMEGCQLVLPAMAEAKAATTSSPVVLLLNEDIVLLVVIYVWVGSVSVSSVWVLNI